MFIDGFVCYPEERDKERTYVQLFRDPSKREVTSVLRFCGSGRYGIVEGDLWFWRGDVFHGTVMREMWNLGIYCKWLDWGEKIYFEREGEGILWSTKPDLDVVKNIESIKMMQYGYPRMKAIRSGTTFKDLWVR
jgi:hypothetical protein